MAVVTRFLDAANHHDSDTLYASVHPAFESFQPLHPDRNFRGPGQLISNWRAIFEAEPGFRLTVLRASTTGNTVWVELHGAGDSAEAAGIFIVGVENGRIRWVRVYSDLVEGAAEEKPTPATSATVPATAERPTGAVSLAESPAAPAQDHPEPVPAPVPAAAPAAPAPVPAAAPAAAAAAAASEQGKGDTNAVTGGPLRLVEPSDEPAPETVSDLDMPSDPRLRLIEPAASEPVAGDLGREDPGPVETLVGPSRIVPDKPASVDGPRSTEAQSADAAPAEAAVTGVAPSKAESPEAGSADHAPGETEAETEAESTDAESTDAESGPAEGRSGEPAAADRASGRNEAHVDPFFSEPTADHGEQEAADKPASTDDANLDVPPAEPAVETDGDATSSTTEPTDLTDRPGSTPPAKPRSFDIASRSPALEPVLSRLRKAFRKP